jgi:hypothetical protein
MAVIVSLEDYGKWLGEETVDPVMSLSACAIYQPVPGPQPYSYAPGPVYTSPFLNFGVGFWR